MQEGGAAAGRVLESDASLREQCLRPWREIINDVLVAGLKTGKLLRWPDQERPLGVAIIELSETVSEVRIVSADMLSELVQIVCRGRPCRLIAPKRR